MPALNFKKQFAPMVEEGTKRQTIRALRKDKRDPKAGDTLYLYTGMRTKVCRKLGEATVTKVHDIKIHSMSVVVDGVELMFSEKWRLAKDDGFSCIKDFLNFFTRTHGIPFEGKLIKWERC